MPARFLLESDTAPAAMDVSQLRFPVASWTGQAPLHQITAIALAFPQPQMYEHALGAEAANSTQPAGAASKEPADSKQLASTGHSSHHATAAATVPSPAPVPLICSSQFPPHAFLLTGSQTGELAHWYIPSYRTAAASGGGASDAARLKLKKRACGSNFAIPRGLLLRQGASTCTAVSYCRAGMVQMFCAGTSEGFLTLWSVGGGRCIRSELALPFGPSQILYFQRYNPLAHQRKAASSTSSAASSSSSSPPAGSPNAPSFSPPAGAAGANTAAYPASSGQPQQPRSTPRPASAAIHNYLLCCCDDSRDVYVIELPSLSVLAVLHHRAPVLSMALVPPSYCRARTPFLVTITAHHHMSLWDLSQIERKREEKIKARRSLNTRQAAGGGRSRGYSASATMASSSSSPTLSAVDALAPLPSSFSNPTSSLASRSASIVVGPGGGGVGGGVNDSSHSTAPSTSISAASASPAACGGVVVRWDDPTQSFLLPLPPLSFTLSPLFVPVSLALSPCGSRAVILFPYAFLLVDLRSFEVEGDIHSMAQHISGSGTMAQQWQRGGSADSPDDPGLGPQEMDCISKHAPWAGAGFLSVPSAVAVPPAAAAAAAGASPPPSAAASASSSQFLVVWNGNGEFIWIFCLQPQAFKLTEQISGAVSGGGAGVTPRKTGAAASATPSRAMGMSVDDSASGLVSPNGGSAFRRSSSKLAAAPSSSPSSGAAGRGHQPASALGSNPEKSGAAAATGSTPLRRAAEAPEPSTPSSSNSGPGISVRLVAQCLLYDPVELATKRSHAKQQEDMEASLRMNEEDEEQDDSGPQLRSFASDSALPTLPPLPASICVHLSGHTVYAGTDEGAIFQWHIPICAGDKQLQALANSAEGLKQFAPTHVSRVADAFKGLQASNNTPCAPVPVAQPAESAAARPAPTIVAPTALNPSSSKALVLPKFNRAASESSLLGVNGAGVPARAASLSPAPSSSADPASSSVLLVDGAHDALLLAVGHRSGMLSVFNMLSRVLGRLDLSEARHDGPVTAMLHLTGNHPEWGDACLLATGGADGQVCIVEMSTGMLVQALQCSAPVLSLHRPPAVADEVLGSSYYRGAHASLLFVNCADGSLRCFSLQLQEALQNAPPPAAGGADSGYRSPLPASKRSSCIFVARGLDAPVRAVFRTAWCLQTDHVFVQTRLCSVLLFCMSTSQLVASWDATEGACILQKHDLIAPGSQLAILAHRLQQIKQQRKKQGKEDLMAPPPLSSESLPAASPSATNLDPSATRTLTHSGSNNNMQLRREHSGAGSTMFPIDSTAGNQEECAVAAKHNGVGLTAQFPSASSLTSSLSSTPTPPLLGSYEVAPPPLLRARTMAQRRGSASESSMMPLRSEGGSHLLAAGVLRPRTQSRLGASPVDPHFQRSIYQLNAHHQQLERAEEEDKKTQHATPHAATHGLAHGYSALNPPMPTAHARPGSGSAMAGANAAAPAAKAPATLAAPTTATAVGATPQRPQNSASAPHLAPPQPTPSPAHPEAPMRSPSPSPPPLSQRSPIVCVDVVTSPGSSLSPLAHLHANVYVWNVHQLTHFLTTHAAALQAIVKRAAVLAAARADPHNAALAAAANAARVAPTPPSFFVISGLLSTLFDWDSHAPIESVLRDPLRLYRPSPAASFASLSDNSQSLVLLFPSQSRDHARWSFDADLSTRHLLAITTSLMALQATAEPAVAAWFDPVLAYYHSTLPTSFPLYIEPEIPSLALFALNVHRPVHAAARLVIQHTLSHLSASHRLALAEEHGRMYNYPLPTQRLIFQPEFNLSPAELSVMNPGTSIMSLTEHGPGMGYVSDEEMMSAAILCWVGLHEMRAKRRRMTLSYASDSAQSSVSPAASPRGAPSMSVVLAEGANNTHISEFSANAQYITNTLLRMIAYPVTTEHDIIKAALACELLDKGLLVFRHHITEALLLLRRLYILSHHPSESLSRAASQTLLDSGKIAPRHFLSCIARESLNFRSPLPMRQAALMSLVALVKKHPSALARVLPQTVDMIVRLLDPNENTQRKGLLQGATSALYALAARYPQVSFHQEMQRYAVGTCNGSIPPGTFSPIFVYDLRTATKWRVLDGHAGDVHALSFHPKGMLLASYSATENPPSVRVWNTGGGGFLSGLLGMEGKCTHSWPMLPCVRNATNAVSSNTGSGSSGSVSTLGALSSTSTAVHPSSVGSSSSTLSSLSLSSLDGDSDSVSDISEPADSDDDVGEPDAEREEDESDPRPPSVVAARAAASRAHSNAADPRSIAAAAAAAAARFSLDELLSVKIMWIANKSLKLKREDGTMIDFHFA